MAGDQRVNEQPGLASLHTIWLREHNRLVTALESLNSDWDQETVFQEARRILTAQWQHIIYSEWLPIFIGPSFMRTFGLQPLTEGYSEDYDPNLDPRMTT